jgi:hypothetical protein
MAASKAATAKQETKHPQASTAVVVKKENLPSNRAERLAADAGKGVSQDRDDKIIPMIRVLQAQSPQCLKAKPEYIKGAEAGDFYFKNMPQELVKGDAGFEFIPCAFLKCWLEFDGPRDESPNFVRRHEDAKGRPAGVEGLELAEDGYDFEDKDGHRFTYSREHYGFADGRPFVFPFGGSGHTTSREWQTLMDQFQLSDGRPEPSFNRKYQVTTVPRSNASGDWYGVRIVHLGEVTDEEYDRGRALHGAVMAGEKVAEVDEKGESGASASASASDAGI